MKILVLSLALLAAPLAWALGNDETTSLHPEQAYPDNVPPLVAPGPFTGRIADVQKKLHEHGFDAGPVNGDFSSKTQAALAQFQLAYGIPVSGMLDSETLRALDVPLVDQAIAPSAAAPDANAPEQNASADQENSSTGR